MIGTAALGLIASYPLRRRFVARQLLDGTPRSLWPYALLLMVGLPALVSWGLGVSWTIAMPELRGFNFVGGSTLSPEYFALLVALVTYTSAFIAEIVRERHPGRSEGAMGRRHGARAAPQFRPCSTSSCRRHFASSFRR